jgi:hypothetical protein
MKKSKVVCLSLDPRLVEELDSRRMTISRSSYAEFVMFNALGIKPE